MNPYENPAPSPITRNLASINEMLAELLRGLSTGETPDPAWVDLSVRTLKEHSWRLGFEFFEERPDVTWYAKEEHNEST